MSPTASLPTPKAVDFPLQSSSNTTVTDAQVRPPSLADNLPSRLHFDLHNPRSPRFLNQSSTSPLNTEADFSPSPTPAVPGMLSAHQYRNGSVTRAYLINMAPSLTTPTAAAASRAGEHTACKKPKNLPPATTWTALL